MAGSDGGQIDTIVHRAKKKIEEFGTKYIGKVYRLRYFPTTHVSAIVSNFACECSFQCPTMHVSAVRWNLALWSPQ